MTAPIVAAFIAVQTVPCAIGEHPFKDRDQSVKLKHAQVFGTKQSPTIECSDAVLQHPCIKPHLDRLEEPKCTPVDCHKALRAIMDSLLANIPPELDVASAYTLVRDAVFQKCNYRPGQDLLQQAASWLQHTYGIRGMRTTKFTKKPLWQGSKAHWYLCGSADMANSEIAVIVKTRLTGLQHGLSHSEEVMLQALMHLLDLPRAAVLEVHETQGMDLLQLDRCACQWARCQALLIAFAADVEGVCLETQN